MKTNLPNFLDKGIYLEDGDILLDWNSSREVLLQLSQPQIEEQPSGRLGMLWRNRRWLGGLTATFYTSLKNNEQLRRIEVLPSPGKELAVEFQRYSRHLALYLGAATRTADRPGQLSRYWKLADVEISLSFNGRSDQLAFVISYHGPMQVTAAEQHAHEQSFDRHLERLGLNIGQWHRLKDYLLDLQAGSTPSPPAGLQDHPVVQLASKYLQTRDRSYLDQAAGKLAGSARQAWLVLDKS